VVAKIGSQTGNWGFVDTETHVTTYDILSKLLGSTAFSSAGYAGAQTRVVERSRRWCTTRRCYIAGVIAVAAGLAMVLDTMSGTAAYCRWSSPGRLAIADQRPAPSVRAAHAVEGCFLGALPTIFLPESRDSNHPRRLPDLWRFTSNRVRRWPKVAA